MLDEAYRTQMISPCQPQSQVVLFSAALDIDEQPMPRYIEAALQGANRSNTLGRNDTMVLHCDQWRMSGQELPLYSMTSSPR